jgi:hypothetical protein
VIAGGSADEAEDILRAHIGRTRDSYAVEIDDIAAADRVPEAG